VKIEETLEDLCNKIDEVDMALTSNRDAEALTDIEGRLNEARDFIARKTKLADFPQEGQ
jgi:hypothetical protein